MPDGQPSQLANLTPWTSETAPRSKGRPKGFVPLSLYLNQLSTTSVHGLEEIIDDEREPPLRIAAARQLLIACGRLEGHRPSDILSSTELIGDRTEGKPIQQQRIEHSQADVPRVVLDEAEWRKSIAPSPDEPAKLPPPTDDQPTNDNQGQG